MAGLVGSLTLLGGEHSDVVDDDARANARLDHTLVILAPLAEEITGAVQFPNGITTPAVGLTEWSVSCCSRLLVCAVTFDNAAKALKVMEWHFNAAALSRVLDVLRELNVFAAELHSFGAFKVKLREKLTNASHAQKALLHVQGARDFTPCHSVQPSGQPWSCKLTYGGAFGVLTTDDIMPATKLASLLYFMGHRYTATHRAAGSQLVKQLQALHANLAGAETDAEDVCTEVVQNYSTYAFPAGMEEVWRLRRPCRKRPYNMRVCL
jgi:hypothetical protein